MTELDLDAIEARAAAASPGPWLAISDNGRKDGIAVLGVAAERGTGRALAVFAHTDVPQRHRDAQFIAAAREDVPALAVEIRRLRAALDAARLCPSCDADFSPENGVVWHDEDCPVLAAARQDGPCRAAVTGFCRCKPGAHGDGP